MAARRIAITIIDQRDPRCGVEPRIMRLIDCIVARQPCASGYPIFDNPRSWCIRPIVDRFPF
jgi:hypothetical protein